MITSNGYVLDQSPARFGHLSPVPATERADKDALWRRLCKGGYLYLSNHLDPGVVNSFREYYFTKLAETGLVRVGTEPSLGVGAPGEVDRASLRRILFDEIVPGAAYEGLTAHPDIKDWFAWLLDDDVHLHKRKIIRHIRPGEAGIGTATQAHYDLVYLREGSEHVLSMWIPLGDTPIEMGGLAYLEGSHHWALAAERNGTRKTGSGSPPISATRGPANPSTGDGKSIGPIRTDYDLGGRPSGHCFGHQPIGSSPNPRRWVQFRGPPPPERRCWRRN
jgi:hypothetical protein